MVRANDSERILTEREIRIIIREELEAAAAAGILLSEPERAAFRALAKHAENRAQFWSAVQRSATVYVVLFVVGAIGFGLWEGAKVRLREGG